MRAETEAATVLIAKIPAAPRENTRHLRRAMHRRLTIGMPGMVSPVAREVPHRKTEGSMTPTITRILVPTDFSAPSDAALDFAKTIATTFGASLHLLHVFEDPFVAGGVPPRAEGA